MSASDAPGDTIRRQYRYTTTPEHLILDPRVGDRAFRLWCRLDRYVGDGSNGGAYPFRESLCVELDCSLASVDRAQVELIDAGWLMKQQRYPGGPNDYTLIVAPESAVMALVETARTERHAKWKGQRGRQRKATKARQAESETNPQVSGSVLTSEDTAVTGEDTGGAVTDDGRVSSWGTAGVVTHDAQKEASLNDNHVIETSDPSLRSGSAGDGTDGELLLDSPARPPADGSTATATATAGAGKAQRSDEHATAVTTARRIVQWFMDTWITTNGGHPIPESTRVFNALVGAGRTPGSAQYVTAALLAGATAEQVEQTLGGWGRERRGLIPPKGEWTERLTAARSGNVFPIGGRGRGPSRAAITSPADRDRRAQAMKAAFE